MAKRGAAGTRSPRSPARSAVTVSLKPGRASRTRPVASAGRVPAWLPAGLMLLHAVLLLWVSARQSVTFDESFHLPAGVRIVARRDFLTSYAQPPLAKSLAGAVAL